MADDDVNSENSGLHGFPRESHFQSVGFLGYTYEQI